MKNARDLQIDTRDVERRLRQHVQALSVDIGERSVYHYASLCRAEAYVGESLRAMGYQVNRQPFGYRGREYANVVASPPFAPQGGMQHLLSAHYDTVIGTPGADDNASGVAALLEVARVAMEQNLASCQGGIWRFVAFTTEEPPAFHTRHQGSRVYAREARRCASRIDGVVNLEMVGYFRDEPQSQSIPFPLALFGYPRTGNFISVVADWRSRDLARRLVRAMRSTSSLPAAKLVVPERGFLFFPARLSDHSSFWDHGYPAVMVTDTAFLRNPHYHSRSDTLETLNFLALTEVVRGLLGFLLESAGGRITGPASRG